MVTLLLSLVLLLGHCSSSQAQADGDRLFWEEANDPLAVCNDYTRAGFFLRRNTNSNNWVIYLESGSLCFSNDTCNRRFFRSEVSKVVLA